MYLAISTMDSSDLIVATQGQRDEDTVLQAHVDYSSSIYPGLPGTRSQRFQIERLVLRRCSMAFAL